MLREPSASMLPALKTAGAGLRWLGILLLALYLLAGVMRSVLLPPEVKFNDEREYLALSDHLRHGPGYSMDGIRLTAARPPGYPFFLAACQTVGGGITALRLVQVILIGATILLVQKICRHEIQPAHLAGVVLLVGLYPALFYTAGTLYPQTLASFLFVLTLAFMVLAEGRSLAYAAAGLTFGALILTVPTFALTLLVVLATARVLKIIRWRDGFLIAAAAALTVGIWTTRNVVVFHRFVPIASNSGLNFLLGNSPNTVPYGGVGNIDLSSFEQAPGVATMDEFGKDHYFQQSALHWIGDHPGRAFTLYLEKTLNFFNLWNEYAGTSNAEITPWKQIVMAISYLVLLLLLAWRLWEARRFPMTPVEIFLLTVYLLSAFTTAIFLTRIRFRLPYDYLLITVIAMHLNRSWPAWLKRWRGAAALP